MRDTWVVCLLVALVALAGCGTQTANRASRTTLTPVSVGSVTPSATPTLEPIAPGLTARGVVAPAVLVRAHVSTLRNASVWFTYNRTVVTRDGHIYEQRLVDGTARPNASAYRITVTYRAPTGDRERTVYRRNLSDPDRSPGRRSLPVDPYFGARIEQVLSTLADTDVVRPPMNVTGGSGTAFRITASQFATDGTLSGRDVDFRADVIPGGVVMSYQLRYETVRNGTRVTVHESLVYQTVVFEGSSG